MSVKGILSVHPPEHEPRRYDLNHGSEQLAGIIMDVARTSRIRWQTSCGQIGTTRLAAGFFWVSVEESSPHGGDGPLSGGGLGDEKGGRVMGSIAVGFALALLWFGAAPTAKKTGIGFITKEKMKLTRDVIAKFFKLKRVPKLEEI